MQPADIPLSLYVHLPWCVRKCPYCDFNSHAREDIPEQKYLAALKSDLAQDLPFVQGREVQSIFFGGGTPSLMSGSFYQELLSYLRASLPFAKDIEITLEANPGTTEAKRFEDYLKAGINRLSLGVQSFDDAHLKVLGRIHSSQQAKIAIGLAKAAGYSNFNIDLMHGLPDQTAEQAKEDLLAAMALEPTHISWYQLTIEPNTEFFSRPPQLPEEDMLWSIQEQGAELLKSQGYRQYEVSAYSRPGFQARHNLNYWRFGDYLGVGAGAHSKVSFFGNDDGSGYLLRYRKSRVPEAYMQNRVSYRVGETRIEPQEQSFEFMMNALRLKDGVESELFERVTQLQLNDIAPVLSALRADGLMNKHRIQLNDRGFRFLNSVLERFV